MVPRDDLPAAVALNSMGFNLTRSVGPAIGGIIVAAAGAAAAFAVNAASYVALVTVLARWKPQLPASRLPRETLGAAMGAGMRYVAMRPPSQGAAQVLGLRLHDWLDPRPAAGWRAISCRAGPLTYGIMLGAFGLGADGGRADQRRLRRLLSQRDHGALRLPVLCACALTAALSPHAG